MALTESDIAQVLEAVKAESKSVESLETVGSLSGVKSLPGQKGDKLVNVPITLLSKPADDAAARAIKAAERVEGLAPEMEAATQEKRPFKRRVNRRQRRRRPRRRPRMR